MTCRAASHGVDPGLLHPHCLVGLGGADHQLSIVVCPGGHVPVDGPADAGEHTL